MTTIACPICAGPLELVGAEPSCLVGHDFGSQNLQATVEREASRALWSAVRALEDTASGARWRMTLPSPPASLEDTIRRVEGEARLLRDLLDSREGSNTESRPPGW